MVDIFLLDNLEEEFDIIASTNSVFSKNHADSFEANEVKNFGECSIRLQEWSLAGAGYTVSIQTKEKDMKKFDEVLDNNKYTEYAGCGYQARSIFYYLRIH